MEAWLKSKVQGQRAKKPAGLEHGTGQIPAVRPRMYFAPPGPPEPEQAMFAPVRTTRFSESYAGCPFPPVEPKIWPVE